MKIFKISQNINRGWDTYSDAVVAAECADDAALIHPNSRSEYFKGWPMPNPPKFDWEKEEDMEAERGWVTSPANVKVEYLGEAAEDIKAGVICASYHAG